MWRPEARRGGHGRAPPGGRYRWRRICSCGRVFEVVGRRVFVMAAQGGEDGGAQLGVRGDQPMTSGTPSCPAMCARTATRSSADIARSLCSAMRRSRVASESGTRSVVVGSDLRQDGHADGPSRRADGTSCTMWLRSARHTRGTNAAIHRPRRAGDRRRTRCACRGFVRIVVYAGEHGMQEVGGSSPPSSTS